MLRNFCAIALVAAFTTTFNVEGQAAGDPMGALAKHSGSNFFSNDLPEGYKAEKVYRRPKMHGTKLLSYLKRTEAKKRKTWIEYVMVEDGEYSHLDIVERVEVAANPQKELGVRYLLEISEVYKISVDNKHVGYVYRTSDHVQAALYQDGAGREIYVDKELKVVTTTDWAS